MKEQGIFGCTVIGAKSGEIDGVINVQITVQIDDGPSKGQRCTYEDQVNAASAKYIGWSCSAVGWKGKSLRTLAADCAAWITATSGASTVEIKHIVTKKGTANEGIWDKVTGIGRGAPKPLKEPTQATSTSADAMMRDAMGGAPPDDAPHAGDSDQDIPFLTCSTVDRTAIAKVLR